MRREMLQRTPGRTTWSTRNLPKSTTTKTRSLLKDCGGRHGGGQVPFSALLLPSVGEERLERHTGRGIPVRYHRSTSTAYLEPLCEAPDSTGARRSAAKSWPLDDHRDWISPVQ